jgi:hypothetical protein
LDIYFFLYSLLICVCVNIHTKKRKKVVDGFWLFEKRACLFLSLLLVSSLCSLVFLHLETSAGSSTSGLLELSSLASHVRLDMIVCVHRSESRLVAEVSVSFSGSSLSLEQDSVGTSGGSQSKLIESEAFTTVLLDSSSGGFGESESAYLHGLRFVSQSLVVSDSADHNSDLVVSLLLHVHAELGDRDRSSVVVGHVQSSEDGGGELRLTSSRDESIEFHQELLVHIVRHGGLSRLVASSSAASVQIDTHSLISVACL